MNNKLIEPLMTMVVFLIRDGQIMLQPVKSYLSGFQFPLDDQTEEVKIRVRQFLDENTPVRALPRNLQGPIALIDEKTENPESTWIYFLEFFQLESPLTEGTWFNIKEIPYNLMEENQANAIRSHFSSTDKTWPIVNKKK